MSKSISWGLSACLGALSAVVPACTINTATSGDAGTDVQSTGGSASTGGASGSSTEVGGSASTGGSTNSGGASDASGGATGAAGGSSTAGGSASTAGGAASTSESCSAADPGNNDRDHATSYTLGTLFTGCLQTSSDLDYYEFTTPASPADGGVISIGITNVGTTGNIDSTVYVTADNGELLSNYATGAGASVFYWFNAAAATKYQLVVQHFTSANAATSYNLKIAFAPVNDNFEPNDQKTQAKPITVGTPVQAFMYAGYTVSTGFATNAWEDWYKVSLVTGTAKFALTDLASDVNGEINLYDSLGASVSSNYSTTSGASVILNQSNVAAGDYYVKVSPFTTPHTNGDGSSAPQYTTQPYTLTVTQ